MKFKDPGYIDLASRRASARHAATRRLVANHRDEYDDLHAEERIARGLPASNSVDVLQSKIRRLEAELEAARASVPG